MTDLFLLAETASGYGLFEKMEFEQIGTEEDQVQEAILDPKTFGKICKLRAFLPFETAEDALEEVTAVAEGTVTDRLMTFLDANLPASKSVAKAKYTLGVADAELGRCLAEKFPAKTNDIVREMLRGVRMHMPALVKDLSLAHLDHARLGLAHAYSRTKMKFDPNRQDKPIINAIALLDGLDKNINTFAMRVKEWYAWHFPELTKIVTDNEVYCKVACHIKVRDSFDTENGLSELAEVCGSEEIAEAVIKALNMSMGQDIAEHDWTNIECWAKQVVKLSHMRSTLTNYLEKKLDVVAPNLKTLMGERIAARLISHAGSLTNLAKFPSSTVQILGAEKALFRALKTKGNTPKYGLIFHCGFIGRAAQKNKGRISRYVANKCSLASRIDCFSDANTTIFGDKMKDQVEERLRYLTDGVKPRKNLDVMQEAIAELAGLEATKSKKDKKEKKEKKAKKEKADEDAQEEKSAKRPREEEEAPEAEEEKPKKKKKKSKAADAEIEA